MSLTLSYSAPPLPGVEPPAEIRRESFASRAEALARAAELLRAGQAFMPELVDEDGVLLLDTRGIMAEIGSLPERA